MWYFVDSTAGFKLVGINDERFEINQLLHMDNTALMADSQDKFGRLVNDFARACK